MLLCLTEMFEFLRLNRSSASESFADDLASTNDEMPD